MNQVKFRKYLEKRAEFRWPLVSGPLDGIEQVVAIPVLAEKEHLFATLESLAENPTEELRRTLVICVVNNRQAPFAEPADIENNIETLALLKTMMNLNSRLRLAIVDACSPGFEFSETGGVGLARKIGLDSGLRVLLEQESPLPILLCLDADTRVEPNYLEAVREHFAGEKPWARTVSPREQGSDRTHGLTVRANDFGERSPWAAVVAYAHSLDGPPEEQAAIICYELFLRYHVLGLEYAGSPYAFPTIGSTMACSAEAYVAAAGMNTRQAGEDFYFLQQLAKTGRVDRIQTTTVHPSPRPSPRVPFGTGQRVRRFLSNSQDEYRLYHPQSYQILKSWLTAVAANPREKGETLLEMAGEIHGQLSAFLSLQGFVPAWDRIQHNSKSDRQCLSQFHGWFDGFRTIKLIHHLRDHGLPEAEMFGAIKTLLEWTGQPIQEHGNAKSFLELLREIG